MYVSGYNRLRHQSVIVVTNQVQPIPTHAELTKPSVLNQDYQLGGSIPGHACTGRAGRLYMHTHHGYILPILSYHSLC